MKQVGQQPNDVLYGVRRRNQDDAQVAFFIYSEVKPSFRQTTAGALRSAPDPARRSIHPPPTSAARSTRPWAAVPGRSGSATSPILGVFLLRDVIWFLHDGSPSLRFLQPDSIRTGPENRRSISNGNRDTIVHWSLAYSALARLSTEMSGSASFHSIRKFRYASLALALFPASANALPSCK